jgi:hypothetical protein
VDTVQVPAAQRDFDWVESVFFVLQTLAKLVVEVETPAVKCSIIFSLSEAMSAARTYILDLYSVLKEPIDSGWFHADFLLSMAETTKVTFTTSIHVSILAQDHTEAVTCLHFYCFVVNSEFKHF